MNVKKSIPVVLGLACLMLTGCSKDGVDTLVPQTESANSSLRENSGFLVAEPYLASTNGPTGVNVYPPYWGKVSYVKPAHLKDLLTGTSSPTHLWGDTATKWIKPLEWKIPFEPSFESMVTLTAFTDKVTHKTDQSKVTTTIRNLKPGVKYKFHLHVGSTIVNKKGRVSTYAKSVRMSNDFGLFTDIDLNGTEALWVGKEISFIATHSEKTFIFTTTPSTEGEYAYAHIQIAKNSIKEVEK